jgi:hypothetical protein
MLPEWAITGEVFEMLKEVLTEFKAEGWKLISDNSKLKGLSP